MNNSVYAKANSAELADITHKTPVASITVSGNPEWTGAQITVDATADTITIASHGFSNGNRIVFVPLNGVLTDLPGGIKGGYSYFVRDVSGDSFKVELTSGGGAVDITSVGTPANYKIEKLSITNLSITGLNGSNYVVYCFGGLSSFDATLISMRVNNVLTASYWTGSILSTNIINHYTSTINGFYTLFRTELTYKNSRLNYYQNGWVIGSNKSNITTLDKVYSVYPSGSTLINANFNPITRIDIVGTASFYLLNGFTMEVYTA